MSNDLIKRSAVAICFLCLPVAGSLVGSAYAETGIASVYAYQNGKTASGERVDPSQLTAAHKSLRFGTMVKVTNEKNGRTVMVRINDRGPFVRGRVIDLTPAAANQLGFSGVAPVVVSEE